METTPLLSSNRDFFVGHITEDAVALQNGFASYFNRQGMCFGDGS